MNRLFLRNFVRDVVRAKLTANLTTRYASDFTSGPVLRSDPVSPDMNVDGSVTPVEFNWVADRDTFVTRVHGVIVDSAIEPDGFGGQSALANGVLLTIHDADDELNYSLFLGGVQQNFQFALISPEVTQTNIQGSTQDLFTFGFNFGSAGNSMYMPQGWQFRITIQDDLSAITKFQMSIQGYAVRSLAPSDAIS